VRAVVRAACAAAAALLVLAACGKRDTRTVLTVYSPHAKDLLQYYEQTFEAAHPDVDVQWVDMGSQDILDRVRSEAANPQADIWFGAPAEIFARAATETLLVAYRPTWAGVVDSEARDPRDLWYGTYRTPEVIAYNTDAVMLADAPKDWDEVLDAKWKGKVLIRDPLGSGSMRAIFGAMILRGWKATGGPDSGYAWLRKLDASTKEYVANPALLYQKLGRQEGLITLYNMPDIASLAGRGIPVSYVIPKSGTPLLVDGIGIVKGGKHPEVARQYYEFVTSTPALIEAAKRFQRIPVRSDVPLDSLPPWVHEAMTGIKPMAMDRELLAQHLDEWMRYWDSKIRRRN
jgi:iron(III) transport system substrate-binding protein